jgi:Na+/H+ antiporter NhaD/arsenite permease-like protein
LEALILAIFVIGYIAIAFEHPLKVNKAASALLAGVLTWTVYIVFKADIAHQVKESLGHHLANISEILFFLMAAMTIVELVDVHGGFELITKRIRTTSKVKLLWILGFVAFVMAAVIDSVPAVVVMYSLIKKLSDDKQDRLLLAGFMVIAVNAGGVFSPLGNLPTLMLWNADKITVQGVMLNAFLPSLINLLVPLGILSFMVKGHLKPLPEQEEAYSSPTSDFEKGLVLFLGLGGLVFVPVFKVTTHLPPFMGMMLVLGILWVVAERMGTRKDSETSAKLSPSQVLSRIDTPSVLFFLGILLAVASLEVSGLLHTAAVWLDGNVPNRNVVNMSIGLLSSIVDNVPLVAATIEMYPYAQYPELGTDAFFWQFLAYTAGTGGGILIIGSAAGVTMMGMAGIEFFWYMKRIAPLALAGYFVGGLFFILMQAMGWLV